MRNRRHLVAAVVGLWLATGAFAAAPRWSAESPRDLAPGKFLVANRHVGGPHFHRSVVLLVEYGTSGAVGLIINKPTAMELSGLLPDLEELKGRTDKVFLGGPVDHQVVLVLFRSSDPPEGSKPVTGDVHFSGSLETLRKIVASNVQREPFRAYVGYAGWVPMQLEAEVSRGDWRIVQSEAKAIFDMDSEEVWPELMDRSQRLEASAGPWMRAMASRLPTALRRTPADRGHIRPRFAWLPARLRTPARPTRVARPGA